MPVENPKITPFLSISSLFCADIDKLSRQEIVNNVNDFILPVIMLINDAKVEAAFWQKVTI